MMFRILGVLIFLMTPSKWYGGRAPLVLYTDFGTSDGAVAAVKGVAYSVSQELLISDLSHEDPGNIFTAAYRLYQAESFWPKGTIFVTVIDPGVGAERLSIAGFAHAQRPHGVLGLVPARGPSNAQARRDLAP